MKKNEFLEKLEKGLAPLDGSERRRVLDYYDEMISDRAENGKTEEEAVAELGSPENVVEKILSEITDSDGGNSNGGNSNGKGGNNFEKTERRVGSDGKTKLKVKCEIEKINVAATDGNEIVFTYYESEKLRHDLTDENGEVTLKTRRKEWFFPRRLHLDEDFLSIDVAVPHAFSGDIVLQTATGAIRVEDLLRIGELKAETSAGSIRAENLKAEKAYFGTSTGSVTVNSAEILGDAEIKASMGSVKAENFKAGGRIDINVTTGSLKCDAEARKITLGSSTGSIRFKAKNADEIFVRCAVGSVKGVVCGAESEYSVHSSAATGKSNLAERTGTTGKKLTVTTGIGSINVNFE